MDLMKLHFLPEKSAENFFCGRFCAPRARGDIISCDSEWRLMFMPEGVVAFEPGADPDCAAVVVTVGGAAEEALLRENSGLPRRERRLLGMPPRVWPPSMEEALWAGDTGGAGVLGGVMRAVGLSLSAARPVSCRVLRVAEGLACSVGRAGGEEGRKSKLISVGLGVYTK